LGVMDEKLDVVLRWCGGGVYEWVYRFIHRIISQFNSMKLDAAKTKLTEFLSVLC
jgi:divalent metal cation (Fe/Co/Zn/Cd) transporter